MGRLDFEVKVPDKCTYGRLFPLPHLQSARINVLLPCFLLFSVSATPKTYHQDEKCSDGEKKLSPLPVQTKKQDKKKKKSVGDFDAKEAVELAGNITAMTGSRVYFILSQ